MGLDRQDGGGREAPPQSQEWPRGKGCREGIGELAPVCTGQGKGRTWGSSCWERPGEVGEGAVSGAWGVEEDGRVQASKAVL